MLFLTIRHFPTFVSFYLAFYQALFYFLFLCFPFLILFPFLSFSYTFWFFIEHIFFLFLLFNLFFPFNRNFFFFNYPLFSLTLFLLPSFSFSPFFFFFIILLFCSSFYFSSFFILPSVFHFCSINFLLFLISFLSCKNCITKLAIIKVGGYFLWPTALFPMILYCVIIHTLENCAAEKLVNVAETLFSSHLLYLKKDNTLKKNRVKILEIKDLIALFWHYYK